ncbi:MerR family transcriptional regulator (plasmid) [Rhodococcus sp. USK10]|nr:MerR family transcriptional regulator [Rhodococcus sp. USK10]
MTIGELAHLTGMTPSTLRFYEQQGLLLNSPARDSAGRRRFEPSEADWLLACRKLRSSGMPIPRIREYVELTKAGHHTHEQRLDLLRRHQQEVEKRVAELQDALTTIEAKVDFYAEYGAATASDDLWLDVPTCTLSTTNDTRPANHYPVTT